jgi:NAD(P)-dependent dehydrogenase (short-subunit alcohol dehydrogenase family)
LASPDVTVASRVTSGTEMIGSGNDGRNAQGFRADVVAIITGGASGTGREVARALTHWGWAIVIVYLEHQRTAEATVEEILAAGGNAVAVRADPTDDLDVQRLFAESTAAFAGVDVVVHTTSAVASLLYQHAARQVHSRGAIVTTPETGDLSPGIARQLHERGISVGREPPEDVVPFLDRWRRQTIT